MSGTRTASVAPSSRRKFRVNRNLGTGAGLLALVILLSVVVGAVWGLLRPAYEGTVTDGGGVNLEMAENVEFNSYITFAVLTGVIGVAVSMTAFVGVPETRGLIMLLWVGVAALVGAVTFLIVGEQASQLVHNPADAHSATEGQTITLVPPLAPGMGFVVAPLMATLSYWVSMVVNSAERGGEDATTGSA